MYNKGNGILVTALASLVRWPLQFPSQACVKRVFLFIYITLAKKQSNFLNETALAKG